MEEAEHQFSVSDAKLWMCTLLVYAQAETKGQEQVKEKERSAERRASGQTTVTMMNGDFRAMTSLSSSRGHVLPHTKSDAVKITETKKSKKKKSQMP